MAFDSSREWLVMFGGSASPPTAAALGDTWQTPGDIESGVTLTSFFIPLGGVGPGHLALSGPAPAGGVAIEISVTPAEAGISLVVSGQALPGPRWDVPMAAGASSLGLHFDIPDSVLLTNTNLYFVATLRSISITQIVGPDAT